MFDGDFKQNFNNGNSFVQKQLLSPVKKGNIASDNSIEKIRNLNENQQNH